VSAYDWFGSFAFAPIGLAIWGPIAQAVGISGTLWLAVGVVLVSTALLLCVRDVRLMRSDS
jgi:hypothetical protein